MNFGQFIYLFCINWQWCHGVDGDDGWPRERVNEVVPVPLPERVQDGRLVEVPELRQILHLVVSRRVRLLHVVFFHLNDVSVVVQLDFDSIVLSILVIAFSAEKSRAGKSILVDQPDTFGFEESLFASQLLL